MRYPIASGLLSVTKQVPAERRRDKSLKEVCYELSVSADWVRKRLGTADVPPHIFRGRFILFPRELFDAWKNNEFKQAMKSRHDPPYWARGQHALKTGSKTNV